MLRLSVSDAGTGFPADFVPVAFERFSRAESGRTSTGSGLGLAIVRAIAEAHGGQVEIEDREGAGACVAIDLPSTRNQSARHDLRAFDPMARRLPTSC